MNFIRHVELILENSYSMVELEDIEVFIQFYTNILSKENLFWAHQIDICSYNIMLTSEEAYLNMIYQQDKTQGKCKFWSLKDDPKVFLSKYVGSWFTEPDKVLAGCNAFIKKQYVSNPKIWKDFWENYVKHVTISTSPTELGLWNIEV